MEKYCEAPQCTNNKSVYDWSHGFHCPCWVKNVTNLNYEESNYKCDKYLIPTSLPSVVEINGNKIQQREKARKHKQQNKNRFPRMTVRIDFIHLH